jgi:hypothetical protein
MNRKRKKHLFREFRKRGASPKRNLLSLIIPCLTKLSMRIFSLSHRFTFSGIIARDIPNSRRHTE